MDQTFIQALAERLKQARVTVAAAESLTGGLVAAALTSVPGSSLYFQGAVVAYSNQLKVELLGIPMEVILDHGAVSEECARAMAEGARRKLGVDLAVATTGIAGPDGGSPGKPVGLVWLAVSTHLGTRAERRVLSGDREQITRQAVSESLGLLSAAI